MADYHIYLHGEGNGSSSNKTTPFSQTDSSSNGAFQTAANKTFSTTKTVISGGAVDTGVAALAKAVPWVAAVVAAIKVTDKILTTGFAHQEEYTGNYKYNMQYNNFKTITRIFTNPVGYAMTAVHERFQFNKQNKAIIEQNKLIGNSILKDFNVGV